MLLASARAPPAQRLDLFWLKDDSLESSENLPDPDVIAAETAEDRRAALGQFEAIQGDAGGWEVLPGAGARTDRRKPLRGKGFSGNDIVSQFYVICGTVRKHRAWAREWISILVDILYRPGRCCGSKS